MLLLRVEGTAPLSLDSDLHAVREEALRCATAEGAWLSFEEGEKGSIEEGKLADFAVLSDDPLACPEEALRDITSELTVVGGRVVHEDGDHPKRT